MKVKIAYILITTALVMGAFLVGKSSQQQPSIPLSNIAEYYINSDGYITLTIKDIRNIDDDINKPIITNYLAENGIPDVTAEMENNLLNVSSVTDYEANANLLTLYTQNGDAWVIEK